MNWCARLWRSMAILTAAACGDVPEVDEMSSVGLARSEEVGHGDSQSFAVPPPPFSSEEVFPCSDCHEDMEPNLTRRALTEEHTEIELSHDEANRWCLDCHNAQDRDYLKLASGKLVRFDESYKLCGQCHGPKLADWKAGIHGKRTGRWNGSKRYLLCAHCHDPHSPRFKPMAPMPAPRPPRRLK